MTGTICHANRVMPLEGVGALVVFQFVDPSNPRENMKILIDLKRVCRGWKEAVQQYQYLLKHAEIFKLGSHFKKKATLIRKQLCFKWGQLPWDLSVIQRIFLPHINSFLSVSELLLCRLVSKKWKQITDDWTLHCAAQREMKKVCEQISLLTQRKREANLTAEQTQEIDNALAEQKKRHDMMKITIKLNEGSRGLIGRKFHTFPGSPRVPQLRLSAR